MKREIKFRAWDKKANQMVCWKDISRTNILGMLVNNNNRDNSSGILMQFTGLLGKNGVEIYEGDIVCGTFGIPPIFVKSIVEYKDGMFLIKTHKHNPKECSVFDAISFLDIEVIGNIYENPELLEAQL